MSQITTVFVFGTRLVCNIGIAPGRTPESIFKTDPQHMVEVFKTDVAKHSQARLLADMICLAFTGYQASFDLEDCDKVLRISCEGAGICSAGVIGLLGSFGYKAAVLEDVVSENSYTTSTSNRVHSITF